MKADLNHILKSVKKRPGMYLENESIYDLAAFITGYECALGANYGYPDGSEISLMRWVERKYGIQSTAWHWSRILHHVAGSEVEALYLFFEIWPEYYDAKSKEGDLSPMAILASPTESVTNERAEKQLSHTWRRSMKS